MFTGTKLGIYASAGVAAFQNVYSIDYGGTDEYLNFGHDGVFNFGDGSSDDPFSWSVWVNMTDATSFVIIVNGKFATDGQYEFTTDTADKLHVALIDESTNKYIGRKYNTALTSDQGSWIHLAFTYSGNSLSSGVKIYRNATQVDDANFQSLPYVAMENLASDTKAGAGTYSNVYANGKMDELSLWNKELSSSEITDIYNSGTPTDLSAHSGAANLIGWWRMGDGSTFPTIVDSSTNSNSGTMTNMEAGDINTDVP